MAHMGRTIEIPYVELRKPFLGSPPVKQVPGTRCYIQRDRVNQFHWWIGFMQRMYREEGMIPLQWVADFVGVSRSAVHKRVKAGGLTVFSFVVLKHERTLLGGWREKDSRDKYDYAILTECQAWRDAILEAENEEETMPDNVDKGEGGDDDEGNDRAGERPSHADHGDGVGSERGEAKTVHPETSAKDLRGLPEFD